MALKTIFRRIGGRIIPIRGSGYVTKALHRAGLNTPKIRGDVARQIVETRNQIRKHGESKVSSLFSVFRNPAGLAELNKGPMAILENSPIKFGIGVSKRGLPNLTMPGHGRSMSNPKAAYRAFKKRRN